MPPSRQTVTWATVVSKSLSLKLFELTRLPQQIQALREICAQWHHGPEHFWEFDSVLEAIQRPGSLVVFCAEDLLSVKWAGVALVDVGPYSADLLYVYVDPTLRGQSLAAKILDQVVHVLSSKPQMEALFLEVRLSNEKAQKLYHSLGMEHIGTRKRYYADGEDALVFKLEISGSSKQKSPEKGGS